MVSSLLFVVILGVAGQEAEENESSAFEGNEAVPVELFELAKEYYSIIGGGPSEEELVRIFKEGSARLSHAAQGAFYFSKWTSPLINGLREILNAAPTEHRLDSLLYEPFHWFMRGLRFEGGQILLRVLMMILSDIVVIHTKTKPQVRFYLYFLGLEEFIGATHSLNPDAKRKRTLAIEFFETDILCTSYNVRILNRYRRYDSRDDQDYPQDLLTIQKMITAGLSGRSEELKMGAIKNFREYDELRRSYWNGPFFRNASLKQEYVSKLHTIADSIRTNELVHD
jgi:hypothetical protein